MTPVQINGVDQVLPHDLGGASHVADSLADLNTKVSDGTLGPEDTTLLKVSDALRNSNDAEKQTAENAYTKIKEVLLNADLPNCRLKFDHEASAVDAANKTRVYKNGAAEGAENAVPDAYDTVSEDFAGWVATDLIQIYAKTAGALVVKVKNMRLHYTKYLTDLGGVDLTTDLESGDDPTISVTNQDP